jgi:hypothetical protein
MAFVFFAIQTRKTSEKIISPMAIIIEIIMGLENMVMQLYSFFQYWNSEEG